MTILNQRPEYTLSGIIHSFTVFALNVKNRQTIKSGELLHLERSEGMSNTLISKDFQRAGRL